MPDSITPRKSRLAVGASALAALGWGFSGVLAKLATASGLVITFYRCWLSAGLLVTAMLLAGRRVTWSLLRVSALGGVLLGADMALFFSAIKLTSVAEATVIAALQPALVLLAAGPLVGERVDRHTSGWAAVAIGGVGIIVVGAGTVSHREGLGDLLAAGSLLAWTGYFVGTKRARLEVDALDYTTGVTLVAAVFTSGVLLGTRQSPAGIRAGDWVWIALLAVVPTGSHVMMNWALRYIGVSTSSVIGSANPIVAAAAGYVILGQGLRPLQIAGGMIGVAAIAMVAARAGQAQQG